jgi:hypothetical protein
VGGEVWGCGFLERWFLVCEGKGKEKGGFERLGAFIASGIGLSIR